jgi:hypothetical protein
MVDIQINPEQELIYAIG